MNILHLASGDLWAGAEVQLYHLCTALKQKCAIDLHIVLLNHGQLEQKLIENGIRVTVLDENILSTHKIGWRLHQYVKNNPVDIIHSHLLKENLIGG